MSTRLNIPPPPPPARATAPRLQAPAPSPAKAPDNLTQPTDSGFSTFQDMNFKVDPAFHRKFKMEAVSRGLSMKDMLVASFNAYLEVHGSKTSVTDRPNGKA